VIPALKPLPGMDGIFGSVSLNPGIEKKPKDAM
jgi:hypothetical protein